MKRILCALLSLILLLTLFGCSPKLNTEETEAEKQEEGKTEKEEKIDWSKWEKPEGFTAGFGKVIINPELPVQVDSNPDRYAYYMKSDLAITCAAVCDGEDIALLFGMDMKRCENGFADHCRKLIEEKFGIKPEFSLFNATHSHNSPDGSTPANTKWKKNCYDSIIKVVEMALKDLKPTEVFVGTGDTTDFAFVRRYLMEDGSYKGIHSGISDKLQYVEHETEADAELRTIRFDRGEEEKDIILVNWQCHAASDAASKISGQSVVSADFVHYLREDLEESMGAHVGYFNGASGNLSMTSFIKGRQQFTNVDDLGVALSGVVMDQALQNEVQVNTGKIRASETEVECFFYKDPPGRGSDAAGYLSEQNKNKEYLWEKYHINSKYEANHIQSRQSYGKSEMLKVSAISFGDIGFTGAPYEMMDQNGMELREASPFQMTFSCAYTNGSYGYIPSDDIWDHGQYEVYTTRYDKGTGEKLVDAMVDMLKDHKAQG